MSSSKSSLPFAIQALLDDQLRLEVLEKSALFGSGIEEAFDQIAASAALLFKAPVAQVTLMGDKKQWFKSCLGIDLQEAPTETSFCAHAIAQNDQAKIVLNAAQDPHFADNPFVVNPPGVRFYAGYPVTVMQQNIGTVCVYDFDVRDEVQQEQITALGELANRTALLIKQRMSIAGSENDTAPESDTSHGH